MWGLRAFDSWALLFRCDDENGASHGFGYADRIELALMNLLIAEFRNLFWWASRSQYRNDLNLQKAYSLVFQCTVKAY